MIAKYTCQCMEGEAEVEIPERADHTGVVFYVEKIVMKKIAIHHHTHSPNCRIKILQEVKIPITDRGVGRP